MYYHPKVWGHQGIISLFFCKEINSFVQQGCIKLIKSDSKYIYNTFIMLQKMYFSN